MKVDVFNVQNVHGVNAINKRYGGLNSPYQNIIKQEKEIYMIEPINFIVNEKATEELFVDCGFTSKPNHYYVTKNLYNNIICAQITVDKEDNFISVNVVYDNGNPFAPFYNPSDRGNNKLYKKVVKTYNKYIKNLIEIGLLSEVSNDEMY